MCTFEIYQDTLLYFDIPKCSSTFGTCQGPDTQHLLAHTFKSPQGVLYNQVMLECPNVYRQCWRVSYSNMLKTSQWCVHLMQLAPTCSGGAQHECARPFPSVRLKKGKGSGYAKLVCKLHQYLAWLCSHSLKKTSLSLYRNSLMIPTAFWPLKLTTTLYCANHLGY